MTNTFTKWEAAACLEGARVLGSDREPAFAEQAHFYGGCFWYEFDEGYFGEN